MKQTNLCPICKQYQFPSREGEDTYICPHCGWHHNSQSENNPDSAIEPNDLSLTEYRMRYKYYLQNNPDYHWAHDHYPKLPQIEPIVCPVCKKYRFEKLTIEDIFCGITPDKIACKLCGWHYDINQQDHPDIEHGANAMSLNAYRLWYQQTLVQDPNFKYFEEQTRHYTAHPHLCPVCGKHKFSDIASHEICPYCGWEDDNLMEDEPDKWEGCSNDLCLNDFIQRYKTLINKNPHYRYKNK